MIWFQIREEENRETQKSEREGARGGVREDVRVAIRYINSGTSRKIKFEFGFFQNFWIVKRKKINKKEFGNFWEYGFALKWNSQIQIGL